MLNGIALTCALVASASAAQPARGPFLQNVQPDRITVCWESDAPVAAVLRVSDDLGNELQRVQAPAARHQEVLLTGLETGRFYRYQIDFAGGDSASGRFMTAPPPGVPITFAIWGDTRNSPAQCGRIAQRILDSGVTMSLHSGDFVSRGVLPGDWNTMFFTPCRELLRSVPLWPALGNHELRTTPELKDVDCRRRFAEVFALPGDEAYYSFDFGDAHVLVLDSGTDRAGSAEQYAFAKRDLAATRAPWRLVMWHHPAFCSGPHESQLTMRTRYGPLLARYNVDLLITGHIHGYQLSRPIVHVYEPAQQHPYRQLISGGGGVTLHKAHPLDPWTERAEVIHHFVRCRIDGPRLTGEVVAADGRVADRFVIDHTQRPTGAIAYEWIELQRLYRDAKKALRLRLPAPQSRPAADDDD